jgi:hypothetical protein
MRQTHVRNVDPMIRKRREEAKVINVAKAIATLIGYGWVRSITEHGLTLTEPLPVEAVKTDTNA